MNFKKEFNFLWVKIIKVLKTINSGIKVIKFGSDKNITVIGKLFNA